jgi:soluble lytic murein transglycosylase
MRKLFHHLHKLSSGCGRLPLLAGVAFLMAARIQAGKAGGLEVGPSITEEAPPSDYGIIDAVLAKRAPGLGLTLRKRLITAIAEESKRAGYDPLLVLAIIDVESDFLEGAISDKGAKGLMQIKPSTLYFLAQTEGIKLSREEVAADPALCVRLGIRYLRGLHQRFGDLDLALMGYNAGPSRIRRAIKNHELDVFVVYPRMVRRDFRRFREGQGLGGDWALAQRTPAQ